MFLNVWMKQSNNDKNAYTDSRLFHFSFIWFQFYFSSVYSQNWTPWRSTFSTQGVAILLYIISLLNNYDWRLWWNQVEIWTRAKCAWSINVKLSNLLTYCQSSHMLFYMHRIFMSYFTMSSKSFDVSGFRSNLKVSVVI